MRTTQLYVSRLSRHFGLPAFMSVMLLCLGVPGQAAQFEVEPSPQYFEVPAPLGRVLLKLPEILRYEVPVALRQRTERALSTHWVMREAEMRGQGEPGLVELRKAASLARQAVLSELEAAALQGSAAIVRALLQEGLVEELFREDQVYYREQLAQFKVCKEDCREPIEPLADFNEVIGGLSDALATEHDSKLMVANYYLQGLLFEAQGDEVGAVEMFSAALESGDSKLVSVVQQHLGDLEVRAGNYERAANYYGSVTEGKYYARAVLKHAWVQWRRGICRDVVRLTAKFRHTVSSKVQQAQFKDTVLAYEVDCAAYELRDEDVVALDPKGVSQVRGAIEELERVRAGRGLSSILKEDFGRCLSRARDKNLNFPTTQVTLGGTTAAPELRWKRPEADQVEEDGLYEEPESQLVIFMESCIAKRLERYPKRQTLAADIILRVR